MRTLPEGPAVTVEPAMLERRAAFFLRRRIGADAERGWLIAALSKIDLTTLEGSDSPQKVRALCRRAVAPGPADLAPPLPPVAAVCVYPALVPVAAAALAGTPVRVASVAGAFPSGQAPLEVRMAEVRAALRAGAGEIDMVINRGAFLAGRFDLVATEIRRVFGLVRRGAGESGTRRPTLKIILETGELGSYDAIRRASDLALRAVATSGEEAPVQDGEVFLKTSTGKISPGATMPAALVMMEAIAAHFLRTGVRVGLKPAGGIATAKAALPYLIMARETLGEAWLTPRLFRFGASRLVDDLVRKLTGRAGRQPR